MSDLTIKQAAIDSWISCRDRLPVESSFDKDGTACSDWCFVTLLYEKTGERQADIARTKNGRWEMLHSYFDGDFPTNEVPYWLDVIEWMPLPKTRKGEYDG